MNSHKLAEILLLAPDLPIATHANNHTYMSGIDKLSHGPLKIGVLETYGGQHLVLGNIHDPDINPPNWYVSRMIDETTPERESETECIWQEDADGNGIWETSCDNSYEFFTDGPKENKHKFCCYCGKSVSARKYRG